MTTQSLGAILRARSSSEARNKESMNLQELESEAQRNGDAAVQALNQVVEFFRNIKAKFEADIRTTSCVIPVKLGETMVARYNWEVACTLRVQEWMDGRKRINAPGHPYHPVWLWFSGWCEENEMVARVEERSSNEGAEWCDWYEISVEPKT